MADAFDIMAQYLQSLGLNPADFNSIIRDAATQGTSPTEFTQQVQLSPQFKQAFPEIEARQKAGYAPMVPSEIIAYRSQAKNLAQNYGLPPGFLDNQTISSLIANDVSPSELQSRVVSGFAAVNNAPQDVKDTLSSYYGVTPGHLAAFFLDPTRGQAAIEKAVASAQIGAAAGRTTFGGISAQEAERLAGAGVSEAQAARGFGELSREGELFGALPGEAGVGTLGREGQIGTITAPGGAGAQQLEQVAAQRKARFGGGGGFTESQKGVSGLASPA